MDWKTSADVPRRRYIHHAQKPNFEFTIVHEPEFDGDPEGAGLQVTISPGDGMKVELFFDFNKLYKATAFAEALYYAHNCTNVKGEEV